MGGETSRPKKIQIAIVDNDALALKFTGLFLQRTNPVIRISWTQTEGRQAIQQALDPVMQPDILLVDMSLGDTSGVSVCREVRRRTDRVPVLGITSFTLGQYAQRLADAGGQGLIGKEGLSRLTRAVNVLQHNGTLSGSPVDQTPDVIFDNTETAHRRLRSTTNPLQLLSPTEQRVMELYANGLDLR
ncbi:response regulator [Bifidobacterium tissieri]